MYCIITDNKKLIKRARRVGDQIIRVEKSVIVDNEKEWKWHKITQDVVNNFLYAFPDDINVEWIGMKALKYILLNNLGCKSDLYRTVYPRVANEFNTTPENIESVIVAMHCRCITNMPPKYKSFFDEYECSTNWTRESSYEFVKACQEYINNNFDSLNVGPSSTEKVNDFLDQFYCISERTLGYKCVKYILENNIECSLETKKEVFAMLAEKFDTTPSAIACGVTNIYTSISKNAYVPQKFRDFYYKHASGNLKSIGQNAIELLQIFKEYLRTY